MMSGQENSRRDAVMRQAASAGYNEEDFHRAIIKENIATTPGTKRRLVVLVGLLSACIIVLGLLLYFISPFAAR
jgi:type IV secretory pathway TrbD component